MWAWLFHCTKVYQTVRSRLFDSRIKLSQIILLHLIGRFSKVNARTIRRAQVLKSARPIRGEITNGSRVQSFPRAFAFSFDVAWSASSASYNARTTFFFLYRKNWKRSKKNIALNWRECSRNWQKLRTTWLGYNRKNSSNLNSQESSGHARHQISRCQGEPRKGDLLRLVNHGVLRILWLYRNYSVLAVM